MNEKKLYQQKIEAQLQEWNAELDQLKAKASGASADLQLKLNKQVKTVEGKIVEGKAKLAQVASASEEAWGSMKDGVKSALDSIKSALKEAKDKFKKS